MTIVDQIRQDPQQGAKRLESEYRAGLTTLARRFCDDDGDAAELVNRTFAEVVANIDRYAEQSAFFGWMSRILVNLHAKDVRRKSNETVFSDDILPDVAPDPDAEARIFREVDASILRDAIDELPADMKETLLLHYFMDLPVGKVGKILSIPNGTVKWRLHYAREILAAKLGAAAKKPGAKALLVALALAALTAAGAATTLAVVRLLSPPPVAVEQQADNGEDAAAPEQQAYNSKASAALNRTGGTEGTGETSAADAASIHPVASVPPAQPFINPISSAQTTTILTPITQDHTMTKTSLFLASASLALAAGVQADPARRIVRDGETLTWPHAYTYYRFVVKDRSDTSRLRIAELALYDADGNRVNLGLSAAAEADKATTNLLAGTYALYRHQDGDVWDSFDKMFDGDSSTSCNAWINATSTEWHWWYFTMRLADDTNPVASYNVALPSEYEKGPKSWALQGSDDHATWITLDERDAMAVAAIAPSGAGWCNGGDGIAVNDESSHIFVERGGTLAVAASAMVKSVHSYGGHVSIASGATLGVDVGAGESARSIGGGLVGAGSFEKTGNGTLAVSGVTSDFAGAVKTSGGSLAFRPLHLTPKFTYYRFVVKERDTSNQRLRISEIALYDADGNRINKGLSYTHGVDLVPGTCDYAGRFDPYGSLNQLFDDNIGTEREGWSDSSLNSKAYFTMRLADDADVAPAGYNIGFGSTDNVKSWELWGSDDGATWLTLDSRDASAVAAIAPTSLPGWCNGGTPIPLVYEGHNAPVGEVDASFFRFTVKAFGTTGSGGTRALSELALYDAQGRRLNLGLSSMGRNYSEALPAGSFTFSHSAGTYNADSTHEEKMFDDDLATRLSGWSFPTTPDPANASSWITYTMRLADGVAPVASYNFASYENNDNTMPINWMVEASRDGSTWVEVDARSGEAATSLLPYAARAYCNNGHPIGFTTWCDRWLAPTGSVVQVANGATMELPVAGATTVAGLAFDLRATGAAGSIANFNPAPGGTLHLASEKRRPVLEDYPLPITFTGLSNAANVATWAVAVNGAVDEVDEWVLRFDENDILRVTRKLAGTVMYLR